MRETPEWMRILRAQLDETGNVDDGVYSQQPVIRWAAAQRSDLTVTHMNRLTDDEHESVRCALAANPHIDSDTLDRLTYDTSVRVLRTLVTSQRTRFTRAQRFRLAQTPDSVLLSLLGYHETAGMITGFNAASPTSRKRFLWR